ncbi:hypothetical protein [Rhizobium sp. AB2/73]|uniref:DUF7940 domain-containing protein n=1 Tax=Rhizobium sp. AB2/73 TaxID=2795216 RepID=UPI000DDE0A23|nr:hypothetical protein [Rhizobium sp. AB2/73]QYA12117.1 hypothetical protein J5284_16585 [Rhizobium sp. AB2/73]UEQ81952.1 hypothetical protein I8E17_05420 [Rhizobium sp. AB2/73]
MKSKLVPDWGRVLRRAWSIRLIVVAGILSGCEVALPIIDQFVSIPRGTFAALTGLVTCGALISRLVVQENLKGNTDADQ